MLPQFKDHCAQAKYCTVHRTVHILYSKQRKGTFHNTLELFRPRKNPSLFAIAFYSLANAFVHYLPPDLLRTKFTSPIGSQFHGFVFKKWYGTQYHALIAFWGNDQRKPKMHTNHLLHFITLNLRIGGPKISGGGNNFKTTLLSHAESLAHCEKCGSLHDYWPIRRIRGLSVWEMAWPGKPNEVGNRKIWLWMLRPTP